MRILLINLGEIFPDPDSKYPTHQLARLWSEMDHQVILVASTGSVDFPGRLVESVQAGVRLLLLKAHPQRQSTLLKSFELLACRSRLRLLSRRLIASQPEVVMAASSIQVDNYAAFRIARSTRAVFVRHTDHVISLAQLAESSGVRTPQPYFSLLQRAERMAYRHACMVAATSLSSFPYMQEQGLDRERWIYLPQDNLRSLASLYIRMFTELQSHCEKQRK